MSLYKRGSKWGVDKVFPDGRRLKRIIGNKKQAREVERNWDKLIVEQKWNVLFIRDVRFKDFLPKYLDHIKTRQAERTFKINQYRINAHILPYFANIPFIQINTIRIDRYKDKRTRDGVAPDTVRNELACLSKMFKVAIRWGYAHSNPVAGVEKKKVPKRPPKFITREEEIRLLKHANHYCEPIFITALNSGLRKNELFNLKWSDIDLQNRTLLVQAHPEDGYHPKNYQYRVIGINKALHSLFSEMVIVCDYVFSVNGHQIKDIRKSLAKAYADAQVNHHGQPLHILRHTFGTRMAKVTNPFKLQMLMGHKDIQTTMIYVHLVAGDYANETDKLD